VISFQTIVFYGFAAALVSAGLGVALVRNPVHAALFLAVAFIASGGLWLLLGAEFLAIALVLVYVGAVMVLLLFVVMMLDINLDRLREGFWRYSLLAAIAAALFVAEMALVLRPAVFGLEKFPPPPPVAADASNTRELGLLLYTDYVYPFQLAAVILLVAIIAAIALTHRRRLDVKRADPAAQMAATGGVRLVSMPAHAAAGKKNENQGGGENDNA
jgi:NADH-quinone oxidoreductase subunit J